jgi:outer membrane protein assembly factor BamA
VLYFTQILKYFTSNKNIFFLRPHLALILLIMVVSSCNPTKYVPKDESLLTENQIIIKKGNVKKSDLLPYIRQKSNKKIFGLKFYLWLYNLSNINKEKWPHGWLRKIGEEPAIFDQYAAAKSKEQIKSYLSSKGYFDNQVIDSVETSKRKSKVYYNINLKPAYTIHGLYYEIADTGLAKLIYFDSLDCMIERGKPYDVDVLQAERSRLEKFIKDMGFYSFSVDNIFFRIDSVIGRRQVDIYYGIKKFMTYDQNNDIVLVPHSPYRVKDIYIYPDYYPKDVIAGGEEYQKSLDTLDYEGYRFITNLKKPSIKFDLIIQSLYIKPGSTFNVTNTERSQTHLMSLKTFRLVNIRYNEVDNKINLSGEEKKIDCIIQMTPMSKQSFTVELEGTNSGGDLGGALNFIYQNKNLFQGAEQFNLKLKGAYETFSGSTTGIKSTREFGIETNLRLPKFLVPFLKKERFIKNYNPTTTIQVAYNKQRLPVYTRTIANGSFGYQWEAGDYRTHIINPFQLNVVKIPKIDPGYYKNVISKSSYLLNSYKDVLIFGGSYSYIYNNQKIKKSKDYWNLRLNVEAAGNILELIMRLTAAGKTNGSYNIFNQPFAQYGRTDLDFRYKRIINEVSSIVYRGFVGLGIPYGNSKAMPFEKQYFEGGANGIRGWQVRSLGPGSYIPPKTDTTYFNQTGDIKIETNLEYRFKLFWILEGAFFIDAGNIWAYKADVDRPGAQFRFNKFADDIAVGTGFGLRYDLKFVLLRTDLGLKIREPQVTNGSRWTFSRGNYNFGNHGGLALFIAIGYPF